MQLAKRATFKYDSKVQNKTSMHLSSISLKKEQQQPFLFFSYQESGTVSVLFRNIDIVNLLIHQHSTATLWVIKVMFIIIWQP